MLVLVLLLYEYQLINVEICVIFSIFAQIPNWTVSILEFSSVQRGNNGNSANIEIMEDDQKCLESSQTSNRHSSGRTQLFKAF